MSWLKIIRKERKFLKNSLILWESTHTAAEVLHGSSAMGGYCFIPRCQIKAFRSLCLFVICVAVLRCV